MVTTYLQYNKEVLTDFFKFQLMRKSKVKWAYFGLSFLCLVIGVLQIVIWKNTTIGIVICALALVLALLFPFQIRRLIKKEVSNMVNHVDVKLVFDDNGCCQYVTDKKSFTDAWTNFIEVYETSKYMYFYTNKYEAVIVSLALLNDEDKNNLYDYIKKYNIKFKVKK